MTTETLTEPATGFRALPLSEHVHSALERAGYNDPTPIQGALIPKALEGHDVIGQAQTGTGKTAAFLLPFLSRWTEKDPNVVRALILAPTRELVVQVAQEAAKLAPSKHFRCLPIYGGQRIRTQMNQLKKGCHLIVGTPGRLIDHLKRGTLSLDTVDYVVLDEADRMLDIGFRPDIERILRHCPRQRQTLLLSATVPSGVLRLAKRYMVEPEHINLAPEKLTVDKIRQSYYTVDEELKFELLLKVFEQDPPRQCIIFCERKRWTEEVYFLLRQNLNRVAVMHGDLSQGLRNRIMHGFRTGKITYLVATDVVGRGIDVRGISHVINYDLPEDPENYVHRIGRTGRIGADGVAVAFIRPDQGPQLTAIESLINHQLEEKKIDGFRAYRRRQQEEEKLPEKAAQVFGRRSRKYRNRV